MSEGNRFWRVSLGPHPAFPDAPSSNYVTTRERGDIPDCVPAVDVYVGITRKAIEERTNLYLEALKDYANDLSPTAEVNWLTHRVHSLPPLSPFRNKAAPSKRNYYLS